MGDWVDVPGHLDRQDPAVIRGQRVALRTVRETDLPALYALINDLSLQGEHLALPLRSEPSFRKEFDDTGFLDAQRGRFLVTDLEDRMLGTIVYFSVNYMDGFEIGYHLFDPAARNKGVMGEALRLAIGYLFSRHKINRLQIVTAAENEASQAAGAEVRLPLRGHACAATCSATGTAATRCCTRCCRRAQPPLSLVTRPAARPASARRSRRCARSRARRRPGRAATREQRLRRRARRVAQQHVARAAGFVEAADPVELDQRVEHRLDLQRVGAQRLARAGRR